MRFLANANFPGAQSNSFNPRYDIVWVRTVAAWDKRSRSIGEGGTDLRILLPLTRTSACWPGSRALSAACAIDQQADFAARPKASCGSQMSPSS